MSSHSILQELINVFTEIKNTQADCFEGVGEAGFKLKQRTLFDELTRSVFKKFEVASNSLALKQRNSKFF